MKLTCNVMKFLMNSDTFDETHSINLSINLQFV